MTCSTCGWQLAWCKGECPPCYLYRRRTGRQRPESVIVRHAQRKEEGRTRVA